MTHVRTSPYYPQSNGKLEAWNKTLKQTTIRPANPDSLEAVRQVVAHFVDHYNTHRLHSGIGYLAPAVYPAGRAEAIVAARERKLDAARIHRRAAREAATTPPAEAALALLH